jgi:hypothetical protein
MMSNPATLPIGESATPHDLTLRVMGSRHRRWSGYPSTACMRGTFRTDAIGGALNRLRNSPLQDRLCTGLSAPWTSYDREREIVLWRPQLNWTTSSSSGISDRSSCDDAKIVVAVKPDDLRNCLQLTRHD